MSTAKKNIIETLRFVITVLILWFIIRVFLVQPFLVDGASMSPNFETHDYLIVDKLSYRIEKPKRGDVVVFKYPNDTTKYFIKRVIGLPGETVEIRDGVTKITKADGSHVTIDEPFVEFPQITDSKSVTLSADEYFVMGDNRSHSFDSRAWGPLNKNLIAGRALLRLYPLNEISLFPAGLSSFEVSTIEK